MKNGTFNTIGMSRQSFGGGTEIWARVDRTKISGGYIDTSGMKAGDIIPAGSMVNYSGPGKAVKVLTANGVSGSKEVDIVEITTGASSDGNITVTLGGTPVEIPVEDTDSTPDAVATKIAAGSFSGWSASRDGAKVTFTANAVGKKDAPKIDFAETGADGTATVQVAGADDEGDDLSEVNGLTWEDVVVPEGCISATCAVVVSGRIYADRVQNGGIPASVEKQLPMIEFVREL